MTGDLLEGINEKSTKPQLWERLQTVVRTAQSAQRKLERIEREKAQNHADKLQSIEDRIRATKPKNVGTLHNVITSATVEELKEVAEFFDDFKDVSDHLPVAVQRLIVGVDVLLGRDMQQAAAAA